MGNEIRKQTAKKAWEEMQKKANVGFYIGFTSCLTMCIEAGYIPREDARALCEAGAELFSDKEHPQAIQLLREAGKEATK